VGRILADDNSVIIELRNVSMAFAKRDGKPLTVLDRINMSIRDGEILGLLGRSGSGKSTLLRIAAGLIRPTFGEAVYRGTPLTEPAEGISVVSRPSRYSHGSRSLKMSKLASMRLACPAKRLAGARRTLLISSASTDSNPPIHANCRAECVNA
jgi:ABC-type oligopeptide transport system ATPase subunit